MIHQHKSNVATVLTACGIETRKDLFKAMQTKKKLQQYLPLAVLKLIDDDLFIELRIVATVLTACGIETIDISIDIGKEFNSCNSTYRLRY